MGKWDKQFEMCYNLDWHPKVNLWTCNFSFLSCHFLGVWDVCGGGSGVGELVAIIAIVVIVASAFVASHIVASHIVASWQHLLVLLISRIRMSVVVVLLSNWSRWWRGHWILSPLLITLLWQWRHLWRERFYNRGFVVAFTVVTAVRTVAAAATAAAVVVFFLPAFLVLTVAGVTVWKI